MALVDLGAEPGPVPGRSCGAYIDIEDAVVVGDSVWDLLAARRARALAVGLLSGSYGREEFERAGAFRVCEDPADLLEHLDEIGIRDV